MLPRGKRPRGRPLKRLPGDPLKLPGDPGGDPRGDAARDGALDATSCTAVTFTTAPFLTNTFGILKRLLLLAPLQPLVGAGELALAARLSSGCCCCCCCPELPETVTSSKLVPVAERCSDGHGIRGDGLSLDFRCRNALASLNRAPFRLSSDLSDWSADRPRSLPPSAALPWAHGLGTGGAGMVLARKGSVRIGHKAPLSSEFGHAWPSQSITKRPLQHSS